MPSSNQWIAFLVASILFVQVPGTSLLFTIGRALTVGRREALLSVFGNALGVTTQVLLVALGLGAVVAASATAYTVVRVAGAAYVIWLGIQAIRRRSEARLALEARLTYPRGHAVRIGFVVGLGNPKTLLYFVAILPQIFNPTAGPMGPQMAVLGVVFGGLAICSDSLWALVAAKAPFVVGPEAPAAGHARGDWRSEDGRPGHGASRSRVAAPGLSSAGPNTRLVAGEQLRVREPLRSGPPGDPMVPLALNY